MSEESRDWKYIETPHGAEVQAGQFTIRLHWKGSADPNDIRAIVRLIASAPSLLSDTDRMRVALEAITRIAGNLTDEAVEAVGGVNDARSRALMVVSARQIAQNALAKPDAKGEQSS